MAISTRIPLQPESLAHAPDRIPVGISECLLGAPVRFDGGHKHNDYCSRELGRWFEWVAVCPENAIGLGTPRESIHLRRRDDGAIRLLGTKSGSDHTDAMVAFATGKAAELDALCGYVVAKRSPTCGLERIKVYTAAGMPDRGDATGLYTQIFMAANPLVPVEDEGRLHDPQLRENFVTRVFVLWRWRQLRAGGLTAHALIDFHAAHKYLLMAHSVPAYRATGRLLSDLAGRDLDAVADEYIAALMQGIAKPVTRKGHANALQHVMGYFKRELPVAHKRRLRGLIEDYREGLVPLSVPLALVHHFLADFPDEYLARQVYFAPHPDQLKLRSFL